MAWRNGCRIIQLGVAWRGVKLIGSGVADDAMSLSSSAK